MTSRAVYGRRARAPDERDAAPRGLVGWAPRVPGGPMSSPSTNRQWRLARRPVGMVKESDFEYREEPLPRPSDGEILVRNLYISFDPAMRGWMEDRKSYIPPVGIGDVMRASGVGQVVESKLAGIA